MATSKGFYVGACRALDGKPPARPYRLPPHHLGTHGVVVGMTGSGKTGLVTVLVEESIQSGVPALIIDVKGDLPNLLLAFPTFDPRALAPWIEPNPTDDAPDALATYTTRLAEERRDGLAQWGIGVDELARYNARTGVRVITPGADAGELLHVLSSLERRSPRWDTDAEGARAALSAAISLLLRLLGRDPDPARSREHVLLAVLAERRLIAGQSADIGALLPEVVSPPVESIGALTVDAFLSKKARRELASALNSLLASPSFTSWRQGTTLDVGSWMSPRDGKTYATIISVAHLDDDERALVLGVILEEVLTWFRGLRGSQRLRGLIVFDEVYGFLPPHPANPPTKRPLVSLMKQARVRRRRRRRRRDAEPMDLDYRALSNAGLWCIGRLHRRGSRARPRGPRRRGRRRRRRGRDRRRPEASRPALVPHARRPGARREPPHAAPVGDVVPARPDDPPGDPRGARPRHARPRLEPMSRPHRHHRHARRS